MIENILWATATEKAIEGADKISLTSVEAVLKNLDRLANIGMWSIGIILLIAAIAVGYNIYVSEREIKKIKKDFEKNIQETSKLFETQINKVIFLSGAVTNNLYAAIAVESKLFGEAASRHAASINYLMRLQTIAYKAAHDVELQKSVSACKKNLEKCMKTGTLPTPQQIEQIRNDISSLPPLFSTERTGIEKVLDQMQKRPKRRKDAGI